MAVSDQQVLDWLKANPNATDADIASAMATAGVSPAQMAKVTGLSEGEVAARVAATIPPNQTVTLGDTIVQPNYQISGSGENQEIGPVASVITYKTSENKPGGTYQQYTPTGEFQQTGVQQKVSDPTKQILGIAVAYFVPIIGAEIAASLGTSTAVGTAIAQTAVSVAQGVPIEKAVLNAGTNLLTGSVTGTQDAKDFISGITSDKATQNVIQNVSNSVINTVAKGGSERDILTNAVSAASGTVIGQQTGSQIIGQSAGTLLATGDPFAAATAAAGVAGQGAAKDLSKTTATSPEKISFPQDLSTADAANIVASVAREGGASEEEIQKKVLDVIGGKTTGTQVAFLPAAVYGGIALAPELTAAAAAGSAAITGGIGWLMSLVGGGEPLPASEQEKNVGKLVVELLRANPTLNTADITAEIQKILPEVTAQQVQVLQQNLDNPTLVANLPQEVVITAQRPEKTDETAKKTGANATDATSVLVDQIKKQQADATKADKLATTGGGLPTAGGGGGGGGGGSPAGGGGAGSQTGLASLAGGTGITVSQTGTTGTGPATTTGPTTTTGDTTGTTGGATTTTGTGAGTGTGTVLGTLLGTGTGVGTGIGTGTDAGTGAGTGGGTGTGTGTGAGSGTGAGTGTGTGTGTGAGTGDGGGGGGGDGGGGEGGGTGGGTGTTTGTGTGGGTGGTGVTEGGEGGGTIYDPINITVSPVKGTKAKPKLPTITGFKRSPLEQALTAYRPAGEIESELGLGREDVWNEASLRLKDALGL